jgi:hypothetical protein
MISMDAQHLTLHKNIGCSLDINRATEMIAKVDDGFYSLSVDVPENGIKRGAVSVYVLNCRESHLTASGELERKLQTQ